MSDSLHHTFGQIGAVKPVGSLTHPQEQAILTGARETLFRIPFGAELIEFANQHTVPVKVLSARDIDFSVIDANQVVIYATPQVPADFHMLAMALGCGFRQVEHKFIGWPGDGSQPKTPLEANIFLSKSVDNIMSMCRIAHEYSSVDGYSQLIDVVTKLGYGDEYKAYKSGGRFEEISQIFIKRAKEYKELEKNEG